MDENQGYIKLHRKILENPIVCKDNDYFAVWIYLLLNATHKNHKVIFKNKQIIMKPGQLIIGRKKIANEQHINESKVERILKTLKNEHQIEQQTSSRNRLITILNWDLYQKSEQQNEQQVNNKRTTSEQQVNTNKNDKNVKNDKNNNNKTKSVDLQKIYFENLKVNAIFIEFLKIRKKIKAVNSELAIQKLINKLNKYDDETKYNMIENSVINSWKDVYPLKESKKKEINKNLDLDLPEWFDKPIEQKQISEKEEKELDNLLNFDD